MPDGLAGRLWSLAGEEHVSLFVVLFGAFQTLLHRYTGSDDIVTGWPVACPASEKNLIALRTDLSGGLTFRELSARVRNDVLEAHAHRDLPFETLLDSLNPERSASYAPLFQVTFQLRDVLEQSAGFPGASGFDLSLEIQIRSQALGCVMTYDQDLFESETIQRMLGHYQTILEAVAENSGQPLARLPILTEAERRCVLVDWNNTRAELAPVCVHQLFEEQVRRTPDAVALISEGRQLTYAELNASANRLARVLRGLGVGPEVVVAIGIERSIEMVVGLLAILKAGGAYAPLDPASPKQRLAFMFADLEAPVLLCRKALVAGLAEHARVLPLEEWPDIMAGQSPEDLEPVTQPGNLAYVLYTSGSSGQPKGVLIPHRALVNYLVWCKSAYGVELGCGSPVHTPIGFDLTITSLFPPLLTGRTAVLIREDPSLDALTAALRTENFSLVKLTPAHLDALNHKLSDDEPGTLTRTFVIGGEALMGENLKRWRKQSPTVRLVNEYGPTEATVGCCVYEIPAGPIPASPVPIGRPIANVRIYVLDRNLQPVPIGVPGELHIAGEGLARGYHRRPELTASKFIRDPFSTDPEARLYKTGDLARYRPDGNLEFLGRLDDQVKIRGFRIELSEIESTLWERPGVRDVAVTAWERAPGDRCLAAFLVLDDLNRPSEAQLRSFLKQRLPEYMLPASYVFLPALPLTANGKIDRRALPQPNAAKETRAQPVEGPRDPLEQRLLSIWEQVLPPRRIGVTDDFFELGGNSLLAIKMLARVEKALARKMPLGAMFQASTIEQLAALLRAPEAVDESRVFTIQAGSRPPFFCMSAGPMFRTLARGLGSDQPFLSVALPDPHVLPSPYRLEDVARHCVRALRQRQREGPYFLGGWSDGGALAYEMAQQLQDHGQDVALLVLFDAENPARLRSFSAPEVARARFYFLGQWLELHCKALWHSGVRETSRHARQGLAFRLSVLKGWIWSLRYRMHLNTGRRMDDGFEKVEHVSAFITRRYVPHPYRGRVVLFQSANRAKGRFRDPQFGWGQLAGTLEIHEVPGNHMDIFLEPNVQVLIEKLRACLREAQKSRSAAAGRG